MAKLVVKFDNDVLDHVEIKQGDMKIGRKPGCDIHLDNLAVSGEHANIFTIGEDSFVQDMGSTNGTFINNKRITKHHLRNGDTVVIGKY
jgi:pSer/pThr/pTyr-binding forkhead associated (FHA) protein